MSSSLNIFLVAGEASSDIHASMLVDKIKISLPSARIFGVGGESLKQSGMEIIVHAKQFSFFGLFHWMGAARSLWLSYRKLLNVISERKPTLAILMDLPDFNFILAKQLKKRGIPVIYYISPQVWVWRKYRVKKVKKWVDQMLVLFPFEKTFYDEHSITSYFVGHPLLDTVEKRKIYRTSTEVRHAPRIAILPGSRKGEILYHSQLVNRVAKKILEQYPLATFKLPVAHTLSDELIKENFFPPQIEKVRESALQVLQWADVALIASGTATLEAALLRTPFCLFYKISYASALLFKVFSGYGGFYGLPNLVMGFETVKEFCQWHATEKNLTNELVKMIENESYRSEMMLHFDGLREKLGGQGATERAASQILSFLKNGVHSFSY